MYPLGTPLQISKYAPVCSFNNVHVGAEYLENGWK